MTTLKSRKIKFKAWNISTRLLMRLNSINCHKGELIKPDHILLQYCGLQDKEGEEIYDQDILLIYSDKYVVLWDDTINGWMYAPLERPEDRMPLREEVAFKMKRFCSYFELQ